MICIAFILNCWKEMESYCSGNWYTNCTKIKELRKNNNSVMTTIVAVCCQIYICIFFFFGHTLQYLSTYMLDLEMTWFPISISPSVPYS